MSQSASQHPNRRELLADGLRFAALGALASVGTAAIEKRRRMAGQGKCVTDGICRRCEVLNTCSLPQALSARKALGRTHNG